MKYVKANVLYDGTGIRRNVYVGFDSKIVSVSESKPDGDIVAEGIVTPAFIDAHSHIGMVRAGEPSDEDESNEHMDPTFPLINAIHSIYMDDTAFQESIENNFLYSSILPGSGNPISGRVVLMKNFKRNVKDAYMKDVGIKAALGYNPRSTTSWGGKRPTTRMGAVALLRERFLKASKSINLMNIQKKVQDELEPLDEIFIDILKKKLPLMVHLHRDDDAYVLMSLIDEFGFKAIINHAMDVYQESTFMAMKERNIDLVYGPLDSHPYKVELKHESWRNSRMVMNSGVRFCMMSDHPVILQRNMFLTLRHFMRFGMSREAAISKITSEPASILGIEGLGHVKEGYTSSFSVWNGDPFSMESFPVKVFAEGSVIHEE